MSCRRNGTDDGRRPLLQTAATTLQPAILAEAEGGPGALRQETRVHQRKAKAADAAEEEGTP